MLFKDLAIGDEFTVSRLSGSFIKTTGEKFHNAVSTTRDSANFLFNNAEPVCPVSSELTEEDFEEGELQWMTNS
ncbi:hypothetical protein HOT32_gp04 [Erwinia phage Faunus]|uniref:Uncharacterized protein n=1 Tax=Erwinia phage Faunus TaxID=2182346 RepID=A0A2U8UWU1_9CAUD|nr:hypothetical protein HOT32_gp04 [Erwinia phage Faunus]AWN08587.1 hypothetical protein [Erwinia phage Faunus]